MKKTGNRIAIPNPNREYIERSADQLLERCSQQIVLLNAGAGYGKTQLLASYVHRCAAPCAWYSLDETDNDFMSFLQYLIKSVRDALRIETDDFLPAEAGREDLDVLMERLVVWLDEQIPAGGICVILDDFQEITNPDVFNLLTVLFETMEDKLRFYLVEKRSIHPFLQEYLASGRCVCVGTDDLKLGTEEIGILLEKENILETGERGQAAEMIYNCTEGWPVGVTQVLLKLRAGRRNLSLGFVSQTCEELEIADYFLDQVYRMLPFDIQMFLKKTSVLDYMTAPACNQVMEIYNSDSLLRYLENEKLFVQSIGGNQGLYRCHSFFRRFLLSLLTPQEQQNCLRRAAYYFMKTPDKIQAAEYGCRGRQSDVVQAVLEAAGDELLREGLYETLERWFLFLKEQNCELSAKSRYIYGKYLWTKGETESAREQLGIAGRAFLDEGRVKDYKGLMLFFAATERRSGNLRQAGNCLAQLDHMPEKFLSSIALAECEERVRYACCLHRIPEAVRVMDEWKSQGGSFAENSFLFAANQILWKKKEGSLSLLWSQGSEDRFLLRSCVLGERMFEGYQDGNPEQIQNFAAEIIRDAPYETMQTAVAWKMLAIWSWESGNYRKAAEQAACGDGFLIRNQVELSCFSRRHEQILAELSSLKKNQTGFQPRIEQKAEKPAADPQDGWIRICCMKRFSVTLPGSEEGEIHWRTKKAKELFAYLFHMRGKASPGMN